MSMLTSSLPSLLDRFNRALNVRFDDEFDGFELAFGDLVKQIVERHCSVFVLACGEFEFSLFCKLSCKLLVCNDVKTVACLGNIIPARDRNRC